MIGTKDLAAILQITSRLTGKELDVLIQVIRTEARKEDGNGQED